MTTIKKIVPLINDATSAIPSQFIFFDIHYLYAGRVVITTFKQRWAMMTIRYNELFDHVYVVLQSKIEEFRFLQYRSLTEEELWNYCIDRKWRKKEIESLPIAEIVATVFDLTPSEVLNYHRFVSHQALDLQSELAAVLFHAKSNSL